MDASPVGEPLLVGFEDQCGMVVGKLCDALDMKWGLDDDLVSSSGLLAHKQCIATRRRTTLLGVEAEFLGSVEGGEFIWDDTNGPMVWSFVGRLKRQSCRGSLVFGA